ncbi:hypothetical protein RJT34_15478 [Clitoria ternatea]|uniref:Mannan endo-1,4-beta-mannosidase n=1 Tax=Clitoria ternatea TaxID=43366 RepID=A0AAN9J5T9_CLITE
MFLTTTTTSQPIFLLLLVFTCAQFASHSNAYPLSTHNRWIIDDATGQRAKLVCGNWAGHLQPMVPEGLDKRPLKDIVAELVEHKFNCARLTYAIYMWTRFRHGNVNDTFASLDVPKVVDAVVHELGTRNVKVLLDNHVSEPKWCCHDDDENGFFYDRHFDPHEWVRGLTLAAKHFNDHHAVVAMSLRNELHGIELQFLRSRPLKIDLGKKMVFETHLYSSSGVGTLRLKEVWTKQPLNRISANTIRGCYRARQQVLDMPSNILIARDLDRVDATWHKLRYPNFTHKFQLLQRKNQDPASKGLITYIMYHPLSGHCAQVNEKNELEVGLPVSVSDDCQSMNSSRKTVYCLNFIWLPEMKMRSNFACKKIPTHPESKLQNVYAFKMILYVWMILKDSGSSLLLAMYSLCSLAYE